MHSEIASSKSSPESPGAPGPRVVDSTPTITISPPHPRPPHEYEIEYLQRCLNATHERLQQQTTELKEYRAQIEHDTRLVYHLNEQIAALEDLVHKQKMTISNQSKAISDPRLVRRVQLSSSSSSPASASGLGGAGVLSLTPQPQHQGHYQSQGVTVSATFETNRSQQLPIGGGVFETNPPAPSAFDIGGGNNVVLGSVSQPQELTTSSSSSSPSQLQSLHQAQPLAGNLAYVAPPIWDPVSWSTGSSSCAAGYLDPATCLSEFASRYRELWAKTELFGQVHANTPNVFRDSHLDKRVKDYVMMVSDKHGASSLLGSPATRFFLIAKAINIFLAREVLKVTVIKGFDAQADAEVGSLKKQLYPDTPIPIRHLMAISIVSQVQITRAKPGFSDFCRHKTREHMLRLWPLIGPLTSNELLSQIWTDLSTIVSDAQMLALDMFSVPFEYNSDFPVMGDLVNPTTMVNSDPFITGEPQASANGDWRVRLGITPVVRARDNSNDAAAVTLLSLGHVLLRPAQAFRQAEI